MSSKNYWCFRIDRNNIKYFINELHQGRLRQGWGWNDGQDLRKLTLDEGAGRNRPMFDKVKKGDILLIPQLPSWGEVALAEATEDWNVAYRFQIDHDQSDYGHIFPAVLLKSFTRNSENVTGNLRSTLKNPSRFWNISHYEEDVEKLLGSDQTDLSKKQDYNSRLESSIGGVFNEFFDRKKFSKNLFKKLTEQFTREEWEFPLVHGLQKLYPYYIIERVGGNEEKFHGTDILIKMPGIQEGYQYAIAIQIKAYKGILSKQSGEEAINQINKAIYWNSENLKLIEKIVVFTNVDKRGNDELFKYDPSVRLIFASEFEELLMKIGKSFIGIS